MERPQLHDIDVCHEYNDGDSKPQQSPQDVYLNPRDEHSCADRYVKVRKLGHGSFGQVWLCKDTVDKSKQAVAKEIAVGNRAERNEALAEAEVMGRINHFNVVGFMDIFCPGPNSVVIYMEYADDGDIEEKIAQRQSRRLYFPSSVVMQWLIQLVEAVEYLHTHGFIHRDVKVANIFLTVEGYLKLGDFGIAKLLKGNNYMRMSARTTRTPVGTPMYISPQVCSGEPYNQKADVWSVGCCLYEICTLKPAFIAKSMEKLIDKIKHGKRGKDIPDKYSRQLQQLIDLLLTLDSKDRPSMATVLKLPLFDEWRSETPAALIAAGQRPRPYPRLVHPDDLTVASAPNILEVHASKPDHVAASAKKEGLQSPPIHRKSTPPISSPLQYEERASSRGPTPPKSRGPTPPQRTPPSQLQRDQLEKNSGKSHLSGSTRKSTKTPVYPSSEGALKRIDRSPSSASETVADKAHDLDRKRNRLLGASDGTHAQFPVERMPVHSGEDGGSQVSRVLLSHHRRSRSDGGKDLASKLAELDASRSSSRDSSPSRSPSNNRILIDSPVTSSLKLLDPLLPLDPARFTPPLRQLAELDMRYSPRLARKLNPTPSEGRKAALAQLFDVSELKSKSMLTFQSWEPYGGANSSIVNRGSPLTSPRNSPRPSPMLSRRAKSHPNGLGVSPRSSPATSRRGTPRSRSPVSDWTPSREALAVAEDKLRVDLPPNSDSSRRGNRLPGADLSLPPSNKLSDLSQYYQDKNKFRSPERTVDGPN